ncbi:peptidoglycan DD-metalloendopeptidase family protein [Angustibacter sp. McL0619]|uniref:peptidoglycan DD-metalloendopeptidase family protein n=1 Tax=Angustibacter sp. McL0619 TaxID=3415676 RepID=UPI003CE721EF
MVREMLLAAVAAFTPSVSSAPPTAGAAAPVVPVRSWGWPLDPRPAVARPFRAPPTPWSAGHRGVDLDAGVGQVVRSAGPGVVSFSGMVAGQGVVVVTHAGGLRTSYEPVARRAAVGLVVRRGDGIGVLAAGAGHCLPRTCLHWGLRRGTTYLDPLYLLEPPLPVLLPLSRQ